MAMGGRENPLIEMNDSVSMGIIYMIATFAFVIIAF